MLQAKYSYIRHYELINVRVRERNYFSQYILMVLGTYATKNTRLNVIITYYCAYD